MRRGDFIITPAWTFHDHGNTGNRPVIWLDGLDIPLVRFFEAGFAEKALTESQTVSRPEGDALARYGSNLLPLDYEPDPAAPTRVFAYPFERTREALAAVARGGPADAHHSYKLRFVKPATGRSPMPTMGACVQLLPSGLETRLLQSTDGTVHVCLEGAGEAQIAGQSYHFDVNDVFVVPSWRPLRLLARRDAVLFSFSDCPVQKALGLWREHKH
jgi:gentisate 1,2-dioxygenase